MATRPFSLSGTGLPLRRLRAALPLVALLPVGLGAAFFQRWWTAPFRSAAPATPDLVGSRFTLSTPSGPVTGRVHVPDNPERLLVLVHGWGGSADISWWRLLPHLVPALPSTALLAVDLPGHGRSHRTAANFTLEGAAGVVADATQATLADLGLSQADLLATSMGGPIALLAARDNPDLVSSLILIATSAYWVPPKTRAVVAAGPLLLADHSPLHSARLRRALTASPDVAAHLLWSAELRAPRQMLAASARQLRRFDARDWDPDSLPPTTWIITERDGIIDPVHQLASASRFADRIISFDTPHPVHHSHPQLVVSAVCDSFTPDGGSGDRTAEAAAFPPLAAADNASASLPAPSPSG